MSLRAKSLRGGLFLAARDVGGMIIRSAGIFVIIAVIGPGDFGRYSGAWAMAYAVAIVAQLGTEVYLVRAEELTSDLVSVAATVLVVSSAVALALCAIGCGAAIAIGIEPRTVAIFGALALSLPVNILWAPAQAVLERDLRFEGLAALELAGDLVLYGIAVPGVLLGGGVWSLVIGVFVWQTVILVGSYRMARLRVRWRWDRSEVRAQAGFGLRYAGFTWTQRARDLVNPLVVGALGGAALVGQVALATRLLESLSFVYRAAWRLSLSAVSRMRDDLDRVRRGAHDSVMLKVLIVGPMLAVAGLVIDPVVPRLVGSGWQGTVDVFPYLALAALLSAAGTTASVLLVSYDRLRTAVLCDLGRVGLMIGVAVATVPSMGVVGFGLAELAGCVSFIAAFRFAPTRPSFRLRSVAPWIVGFGVPLAGSLLVPPARILLLVPLAILLVHPATNRTIRHYLADVLRAFSRRRTPAQRPRVVVLAWTKRPRRQQELAAEIGGTCRVFTLRYMNARPLVPLRYVIHSVQTLAFLLRTRPDVVIVTCPPSPAGAVVAAWASLANRRFVLDSHPAAFGAQGDIVSARLLHLHRWAVRRSAAVLVTTDDWVRVVHDWGGRGLVVHEPPPAPRPTQRVASPSRSRPSALYVTIFAPDEPLDVVIDAARRMPHIDVLITGDDTRCPPAVRAGAPGNVQFVGYLHGRDYEDAVEGADIVLALTTEPTSVMRAAYEAVYARRPLVVSDWPALAEVFPYAQLTGHDPSDLAAALEHALDIDGTACARAEQVQRERWCRQLAALERVLATNEDIAAAESPLALAYPTEKVT